MAFRARKFKLAESPFRGDTTSQVVTYIFDCDDPDPTLVFNWLATSNAAATTGGIPDEGMQQPSGAFTVAGAPIPAVNSGLPLDDIRFTQESDCDPAQFRVTATWKSQTGGGGKNDKNPTVGQAGVTYSWESAPDQETLKRSIQTIAGWPPQGAAVNDIIDFAGAINVNADGSIEGVKVPSAAQKFSLQFTNFGSFYTGPYRAKVSRMRGKVNSESFYGHPVGEVRFLGATGSIDLTLASSKFTIKLNFGIRENASNIHIPGIQADNGAYWYSDLNGGFGGFDFDDTKPAGAATSISKRGWDYLWVYYEDGLDTNTTNPLKTKKAGSAYVEQVLPYADLNQLFV